MKVFGTEYTTKRVQTQTGEKLRLYLIIIYDFCRNIKSFSNENFRYRIHYKTEQKFIKTYSVYRPAIPKMNPKVVAD